MATIAFDVFLGLQNVQELVLLRPAAQGGGAITDLTQYTRMVFTIGGETVDSATNPTDIWWDDTETRTVSIDHVSTAFTGELVKLKMGVVLQTASLAAGTYRNCCLTVFDADHPSGAIYSNSFTVTAITPCS